jgi:hypothetical protein
MNRNKLLIISSGVLLCVLACELLLPHFDPPMPAVQYFFVVKRDIPIICLPIVAPTIWALKTEGKK